MLEKKKPVSKQFWRVKWGEQFVRPTGLFGVLAGYILIATTKKRSLWVLSLLNIKSTDKVLEVGFGPGADIKRASVRATDGFVTGIDPSETMLNQAKKRNATAIKAGKVALHLASMSEILPYSDDDFSKVFSINSFQFWQDSVQGLKELRRVLKPTGLIVIAVQPMHKGATDETVYQTGQTLLNSFEEAGFKNSRLEVQPMKPRAVACVIGSK